MKTRFDIVTIIGTGLMGASLGLALKHRGLTRTVRGLGRRQETLDTALRVGAVDDAYLDLATAVDGSELVVICTPAALVPNYLDELQPLVSDDTAVTDVASTKATICAHARDTWSKPLRFVGSHPMAGSEKFGPEHANPNLYEHAVTFVEDVDDLSEDALNKVTSLWEGVGSRVVPVAPATHDALAARTSHVPHIVASALAQLTDDGNLLKEFVGQGFRDITRVAEGRPEIWRDICLTNSSSVHEGLADLIRRLQDVSEAIENEATADLQSFFEKGRAARRKSVDE